MSNQTYIKKDRISFAVNSNEVLTVAPANNNTTIYFGNPDLNSNVGVLLSNQYIYADGTYISNLPPGNISGWAFFPALSNIDMNGNNLVNATQVYSSEVRTTNVLTDSIYAPNGIGNINVRNNIDMNNNVIGSINSITFMDGSAQYTSADTIVGSTIIGLGTYGYISTSQLISTVTGLGTGGGNPASWAQYPAITNVDIASNIISNAGGVESSYISIDTLYGYTSPFINAYVSIDFNSNYISNIGAAIFSYPYTTYKDGLYMTEYTAPDNSIINPVLGLSYNQIPFVGTSEYGNYVNLYNVNKTFYFDGNILEPFNNVIFSCNGIFCYSNVGTEIYKPIAQDWSFYPAGNTINMNNNDIINIHAISAYGDYPVEFNSYINITNKSLSNISSLGFYDVVTPSSNSVLHTSNSLLYYNNSNEIIGGTLQYLPQLISFAPFSPNQIPYLGLWLDAKDPTTFNLDSDYIYQWYDKSQNSNTFTTNSTYPYYNGSAVPFDGTFFMVTTNQLTFDTNTYVFMVASLGTIEGIRMALALNDINLGDYSMRYNNGEFLNVNECDMLYPIYYANGYSNGTVDFTQIHLIDGFFNNSGTSIMRLSSDLFDGERQFIGNINEVIVYNGPTAITNEQITQVRNYLSDKWNIVSFNPTQIPNLALWLDGKDATTFTVSGGNITQWNDKSANANNFTASYGNTAYLNGALFNGNSVLSSAAGLSFDTNTYVFMVASLVVTGTGDLVRMAFATTGDYSMRYYGSNYVPLGGGADILLSFNANGIPNGPVNYTQPHIIDGAFSGVGASIMQLSSGVNNRYFTGSINEIVVYSNLTPSQIIQVRTYLANKWNIILG